MAADAAAPAQTIFNIQGFGIRNISKCSYEIIPGKYLHDIRDSDIVFLNSYICNICRDQFFRLL